jgi:hypothetical protein
MTLPAIPDRQHAALSLRLGKRARLSAEVTVTSRGLLAIGGLVSSILVSTALIVHVARGTNKPNH